MPMYYRAIELLFSADCINESHSPLIDDLDLLIQPDLQKANYIEYSSVYLQPLTI